MSATARGSLTHDDLVSRYERYVELARKFGVSEEEEQEFNRLDALFEDYPEFPQTHKAKPTKNGMKIECLHESEPERQGASHTVADSRQTKRQKRPSFIKPIGPPDQGQKQPTNNSNSQAKLSGGITLASILEKDYPEPEWIIPELLPVGLAALGGRPKEGKSYMALKLAIEASRQKGKFLGQPVSGEKVLYIALEDSERRLKHRLSQLKATNDCNVEIHVDWPTGKRGMEKLESAKALGFTLIIIDTVSALLGGKDQLKNHEMNTTFNRLLSLCQSEPPVTILLIDHFRKGANPEGNPIDDMWGATAKGAKLDVAWGLYSQRGKKSKLLKIQGRDLEDQSMNILSEPNKGRIVIVNDNGKPEVTGVQEQILDVLRAFDGASNIEVASALDKDRSNIYKELQELVRKGKVEKEDSRTPHIYTVKSHTQQHTQQ